jgi:chemotaxis protein methyltransferase CheR
MHMLGVELTEIEFEKFRALIYRVAGIRIPETKRVMVSNRLRRRLRATGIGTFSAYYAHLTSAAGTVEMPLFLDEITTNETYFFRDPQHYEWLGGTFLPEVAQQARSLKRSKSLRIWSAACSTGEELYSVALKVAANRQLFAGWKISLLGTDLSGAVLDAARAGSYDARAVRLVPPVDRSAHFDHDQATQRWTLKPEVRAMATWKRHNLLNPPGEEPFDCIFLKNVLIYFDPDSKQRVVRHLLSAMARGGYLVVGPTEGVYNMLGSLTKQKTWLYQRAN